MKESIKLPKAKKMFGVLYIALVFATCGCVVERPIIVTPVQCHLRNAPLYYVVVPPAQTSGYYANIYDQFGNFITRRWVSKR